MIDLKQGDCLIESDKIESGSVDLILTDLPYGTMANIDKEFVGYGRKNGDGHVWDNVIDTNKIMQTANRILRKNGKMVLFAQQPFTTELINKQILNLPFNYSCIWEKDNFANALFVNKACVSYYEDILIFSKQNDNLHIDPLRDYSKKLKYFIGINCSQINKRLGNRSAVHFFSNGYDQFKVCNKKTYDSLIKIFNIDKFNGFLNYNKLLSINKKTESTFNIWQGNKYKSNILKYKKDYNGYHPTQKPILLLEDLIKTFSNENDLIVDLTMGSGSTGVACINTKRNFIGIELDKTYFDIATKRISEAQLQTKLF